MGTRLLSNKKMFSLICILVGLGYTLMFTGCATIVHGIHQDVGISSTPSSANVRVDGMTAVTPTTLNLKRNHSYTVTFEKEGYESGSATFSSGLSGWLWGNIIFGGLIGLAVV